MDKRKMNNICIAILCVLTLGLMSSCKEEQILYGNHFERLDLSIEDQAGNNCVLKWIETSDDLKETQAEYVESREHPSQSCHEIFYVWTNERKDAWFFNAIVLDLFRLGDSTSWRFKMYPDDAEEIIFEGKVIKNNKKGRERDIQIQWSFRGTELSIENPKQVTLIRTDDGRYTLKQ